MIYRPTRSADRGRDARGARRRARGRFAPRQRPQVRAHEAADGDRSRARLRHPDRGPERLAAACGGAPGGNRLLDRRPRLDQRPRGERPAHAAREARPRRQDHDRLDRDLVPPRISHDARVRSTSRQSCSSSRSASSSCCTSSSGGSSAARRATCGMPQESFILAPSQAAAAGLRRAPTPVTTGALVAVKSPALERGRALRARRRAGHGRPRRAERHPARRATSSRPSQHARVEPRRDGVWVEDIGSTNGTYVNGTRLDRPQRLTPGDVVRIGETDLRYER